MLIPQGETMLALGLTLAFGLVSSVAAQNDSAQPEKPEPCLAPEARQFDFWLGAWNLSWESGTGRNTITYKYGTCVIEENFSADPSDDGSTPLKGTSVSVYSPQLEKWRQTWVDNQGEYLDFVGGFSDGIMTLSREAYKDGEKFYQRMVWFNISEDSLDWNWERSKDGAEWKILWKIHYQRRK